jgi:hypothetical protein
MNTNLETTTIEQILKPRVGQRFYNEPLEELLNSPDCPYRKEVDIEINDIINSPNASGDRSVFQIYRHCESGKLAEIIVREYFTELNFEKADKKYHDLYCADFGNFVEVKRWSSANVLANLQKYLRTCTSYNKSEWLLIFTYDKNHTWLERIVHVPSALQNLSNFVVEKRGQSYSISESTLTKLLSENALITFKDGDKTYTETVEWFNKHKKTSKFGLAKGGYYVFDNQVRGM